ncbi:FUSC family protein [Gluconacetobacter entanii]|nr:FUSC family protein [Gluconacetobacter entanii]
MKMRPFLSRAPWRFLARPFTTALPGAWLYAPRLTAAGFSLRTTIAALLALAIAFGMELGEPQWAPMTVWIVAQGTRGESISKAHWRIVGTLAGIASAIVLIAAFPQSPWLFFPALSLWVGLCTALGTLVHNFRSYAFVLTAYTCAIVALSATAIADQVFTLAMARGSYILLGVICEMVVGMVCLPNVAAQAREAVTTQLRQIITQAAMAVRDILAGRPPPEGDLHGIFSRALLLNDRIEFSAIEVGREKHVVAFARATLGLVTRMTSRGLGMRSRLLAIPDHSALAGAVIDDTIALLGLLPDALGDARALARIRTDMAHLTRRCADGIAWTTRPLTDNAAIEAATGDRIVLQGMELLLHEISHLLACFADDPREALTPGRFSLPRPDNWHAAWHNGLRSGVAVLTAALIWETTAWAQGALFVTFVCVVCARFASFSNTVLASAAFFYGAVWAAMAAVVPVFVVMPLTSAYPVLCFSIAIPMFIGGLATRNPSTAAMAASFSNFFPYLLGLDNHSRIDELQWFNTTFALLSGLGFGVLVFRYVLPFNLRRFCALFRARTLGNLHRIGRTPARMEEDVWIGGIIQGMENLIAHMGHRGDRLTDAWLHGAFSVMTIGRNLLYLRDFRGDPRIPDNARADLSALFDALSHAATGPATLARQVRATFERLHGMERTSGDTGTRIALSAALGGLIIVATELGRGNVFFSPGAACPDPRARA